LPTPPSSPNQLPDHLHLKRLAVSHHFRPHLDTSLSCRSVNLYQDGTCSTHTHSPSLHPAYPASRAERNERAGRCHHNNTRLT
ncbi:MAG: hypothetical protein V1809_10905, partial [Planctomycetota bacterium]